MFGCCKRATASASVAKRLRNIASVTWQATNRESSTVADLAARVAVRKGDGEALFDHFERTRAIRKGIVDIGQDSPAPDFGRPHPDLKTPLPKPYAGED